MKSTEEVFAQLQALGAGEFAHLNGPLAGHLRGTEALLREWNAGEALCAAGLFHAIYGTDGYNPALTDLTGRKRIAELIGSQAEELAYLYGACNRQVFYPRIGTKDQLLFADRFAEVEYAIQYEQLTQLCELILANELEIARNNTEFRTQYGEVLAKLFGRMAGLVSKAGFSAYQSILRRNT